MAHPACVLAAIVDALPRKVNTVCLVRKIALSGVSAERIRRLTGIRSAHPALLLGVRPKTIIRREEHLHPLARLTKTLKDLQGI